MMVVGSVGCRWPIGLKKMQPVTSAEVLLGGVRGLVGVLVHVEYVVTALGVLSCLSVF